MLKYGDPYYHVDGIPFLKGSDDIVKTRSDPYLVLLKHPLYHYAFHYIPIEYPVNTVWEGVDAYGDFGEKGGKMKVSYIKEIPNLAIFKVNMESKTIKTSWRVSAHEQFMERYSMIVKEIPLNQDIKRQILEHYCVKSGCFNRGLCIDVENLIFIFLGYKNHLRKIL